MSHCVVMAQRIHPISADGLNNTLGGSYCVGSYARTAGTSLFFARPNLSGSEKEKRPDTREDRGFGTGERIEYLCVEIDTMRWVC